MDCPRKRGGPSGFRAVSKLRDEHDATRTEHYATNKARRAQWEQTQNRLAHPALGPEALTRPQGDRGHKFMRAFVARPGVPDATSEIKSGFFGDQHDAVAAGAFGAAEIVSHGVRGSAGQTNCHRRSSATFPTSPDLSRWSEDAWRLWRCHDAIMKLSWPYRGSLVRSDNDHGRICIKDGGHIWIKLQLRPVLRDMRSAKTIDGNGALRATAITCCNATTRHATPATEQFARRIAHSAAACADTCWRKRGMTSSAMSCMDCRSQASFGPSQSTPVIRSVPKGPTSSRNATSLSRMVLGEP
jgi:hypothetical protein